MIYGSFIEEPGYYDSTAPSTMNLYFWGAKQTVPIYSYLLKKRAEPDPIPTTSRLTLYIDYETFKQWH